MSKDEHGNCNYCKMGMYQPNDINDEPGVVATCMACEKGTFAERIDDIKEFNSMPKWLKTQQCQAITPKTSDHSCIYH